MEKLLTIEELAKFIRVSTRTVYLMLDDEELHFAIKLKGSWRFRESGIQAWLESHKVGQAALGAL